MIIPTKEDGKTIGIAAAVAAVLVLTLVARYAMLPFESDDYRSAFSAWYEFIYRNGAFLALKHEIYTYPVAYFYLLAIFSLFEVPALAAIKTVSIIFDYVMAFFVYRCVRLKYRGGEKEIVPILAGLATLFAPTVFLNSSTWGQCDAIYTSFLVMSLYYLLLRREKTACAALGLAFCFKPQAIFLAPLFLWLLARKEIRLHSLFLVPTVWLGSLLPAWFVGRPLGELLLSYIWPDQWKLIQRLSHKAPNLYAWIPNDLYSFFVPAGIIATMIFVAVAAALLYMSRARLTKDVIVLLATFSVLVVPYILPKMQDRYWFPADVISIILAFYFPRFWYVPVVIGLCSLLNYIYYLTMNPPIQLSVLAILLLLPIAVLGQELVRILTRKASSPAGDAGGRTGPADTD